MRVLLLSAPLVALVAATLAGASGVAGHQAPAQSPAARMVAGVVSGTPASGITVTLSSEGGVAATAITGPDGSFAFPAVAPGVYVVSPSRPGTGFVPASRRIVVVQGDLAGLDFSVVSAPRLAQVEPGEAGPGSTVTLSGEAFGAWRPGSTVVLGLVPLEILSWTEARIEARVPRGARSGALRVVASGAASTPLPFSVSPPVLAASRAP